MIPFARMVQYNNIYVKPNLLEIDFSRQNVGDQFLVDWTGQSTFTRATGNNTGVVEFNATLGTNVMRFNSGRFDAAMNQYLNLTNRNIEISMVVNNNNATAGEIFCTGDFNGSRVYGMNLSNTLNGTNRYQLWLDNAGFVRVNFGAGLPNTGWDTIVIRIINNTAPGYTQGITTTVNGISTNFGLSSYGVGNKFTIGASYTGGTPVYWNGLMQSLQIKEL